ncbi:MAG: hypothetical protein JSU68_12610 [Phycisphaerales bacterium]|nr:MAG: hypothetical protein JSU68_12610 [Phycisphaerales bacterium]
MYVARMFIPLVVAVSLASTSVRAETIALHVNAYSVNGTPLSDLVPGDVVVYELAVSVDSSAAGGNLGLASIVYDVVCSQATTAGYWLTELQLVESGFAEFPDGSPGALRDVGQAMYMDSGTTAYAGYNGGWGFDNSGLPSGGDATLSPGLVSAAGILAPLTWTADVNPSYPGQQPYARLGVGIGPNIIPAEDPAAGGMFGGFGQDLSNVANPIPGDGHWIFQRGQIDTSGWSFGTYDFQIAGVSGAVFDATLDYNQDQQGGFRVSVLSSDIAETSFSFSIPIPEPPVMVLFLLGGLTAYRRHR